MLGLRNKPGEKCLVSPKLQDQIKTNEDLVGPVGSGRMWKTQPSVGSVTSSDSAVPSNDPAP